MELDLLPRRITTVLIVFWKGSAVGRRCPMIGTLDGCFHGRGNSLRKEFTLQYSRCTAFMTMRGAHQDQRLLRRIVQAGVEFGLPEDFVGHCYFLFGYATELLFGVVEIGVDPLPHGLDSA